MHADAAHEHVAVEAEDFRQQFGAEAVHHRHDDDEGGDAEHDAGEGEAGDDRDEALAAAGTQVAHRQQPLEGAKGAAFAGFTGGLCDVGHTLS